MGRGGEGGGEGRVEGKGEGAGGGDTRDSVAVSARLRRNGGE